MSARKLLALGLLLAVVLAGAVSPFVSSSPDGLGKVAEQEGFLDKRETGALQRRAPAGGYVFPGVEPPGPAKALAGVSGALLVGVVGLGYARLRRRRAP